MFRLDGKLALITGASGGIGAASGMPSTPLMPAMAASR